MADRQLFVVVSGRKAGAPPTAWRGMSRRRCAGDAGAACRENACVWNSASRRRPPRPALISAGLLIVNPPWTLAGELKAILPELEKPLGQGGAGRFRLETPKP